MTTTQRRIVDGRTTVIARILPTDRPIPFGLRSDRVSGKVWERYGEDGDRLARLVGALEDARGPSFEDHGWSSIDDAGDGCDYSLIPNELDGFTLLAGSEPTEYFPA
jgi:hypothetical protein